MSEYEDLNGKKRSSQSNHYQTTHTVHNLEPDYTRPVFEFADRERLLGRLRSLYGDETAGEYIDELIRICRVYYAHKPQAMIDREKDFDPRDRFTEEDIILITYGDLLRDEHRSPLATLADFCDKYLEGTINTLHILPFFPFSSDRGFAIIDFTEVDPNLGTWQDIEDLEGRYQLMFDGVINHVSSKSTWFQEFLNDNPRYRDFFTAFASPEELTPDQRRMIFRPRTTDILSEYRSINGPMWVWTTFSSDQIDLNFKNPEVLLQVLDVLLTYVRHGADIIRLDAVTYLWEEPGTNCIHLSQTHEVVKLFRDILDLVAPGVALITETNVPHQENISYFGDGTDEAHMVYNFALPPLVLHTFYRGDATALSNWASELDAPSDTTTFFNFLDSHDGVGLLAVKSILSREDINYIIKTATENGGYISYKTGEDGRNEPYEINITWYSALNREDAEEDIGLQVKRFVASRSPALVLGGVPGIYLHSLIGSRNDVEAVLATRSKRAINRTVMSAKAIIEALEDPRSKISLINRELGCIIRTRTRQRAFHPNGAQKVLFPSTSVFAVLRLSPDGDQRVLTLTNVTAKTVVLEIPLKDLGTDEEHWYELIGHREIRAQNRVLVIRMEPYDVLWYKPYSQIIR